jgi:mannose-6-phosphate isomerase-like protein (cupin superfamily)
MKAFETNDLLRQRAEGGERYLEFLRDGHFSGGLYVLEAGEVDPQTPHAEDEVYYVVRGLAGFECEGHSVPVSPGSILFVEARARHRFHSIAERLEVLVFFAPPESQG